MATQNPQATPAVELFSDAKPVAFIENKAMDFEAIQSLLSDSKASNHWANYGPASQRLESFLEQKLHLPPHKKAVMCKSGTAALQTLVHLEEHKAGRQLNWVISAFGFIASNIGCLSDAQILDCDASGMLSIDALQALPESSWDGVVITNIFGLCQDISAYEQLCKQLNKVLIVDNAVGLFSGWRHQHSPNEAISFHQTKPWGIGEGGCIIVNEQDDKLIKDMLCFGRAQSHIERRYCSNEKLADINAASIMAWLQQMFEWYPVYAQQAARIAALAEQQGFTLLLPLEPDKPYGNVPLLAPQPIADSQLNNPYITLRKYYTPLAATPTAKALYDRIINVPCHSETCHLSDQQLSALFQQLVAAH
ncbi:DegT/DnrJ/EryC1/StrS aminotransferase family protein [Neiella sp. HB171785]|uniref:DegT/DnrJ/EryC1/StrS aminotransferase family protein n=1 Tax=Neiella litorisoli TaxID=2771431 RepID=A0A8J6R3W6_9GAMM|nr:DegT/DnrJ/EryC1/StrS family aminotransferase [Neiella litorisoli]MBD1390850.1 DegT/DnrJ/EryC1/StrS aminotransferase family protein [Neiella litorisoli]